MTPTQLQTQFDLSAEVDNISAQQKIALESIKQAKYAWLNEMIQYNARLDEYERLGRAKEYRLDALDDISEMREIEHEEREKRAYAQMEKFNKEEVVNG